MEPSSILANHKEAAPYHIDVSIIKTFENEKGCRDDKQKKGKNKVGMSGMGRLSE